MAGKQAPNDPVRAMILTVFRANSRCLERQELSFSCQSLTTVKTPNKAYKSSARRNASLALSGTEDECVLGKVNEDRRMSQGDPGLERLQQPCFYAPFRAPQKQS